MDTLLSRYDMFDAFIARSSAPASTSTTNPSNDANAAPLTQGETTPPKIEEKSATETEHNNSNTTDDAEHSMTSHSQEDEMRASTGADSYGAQTVGKDPAIPQEKEKKRVTFDVAQDPPVAGTRPGTMPRPEALSRVLERVNSIQGQEELRSALVSSKPRLKPAANASRFGVPRSGPFGAAEWDNAARQHSVTNVRNPRRRLSLHVKPSNMNRLVSAPRPQKPVRAAKPGVPQLGFRRMITERIAQE